ncbi:MAG: hypothetical protein RL518_1474 [Pseudomonadota bacterium]|jgi:hypothetical protein
MSTIFSTLVKGVPKPSGELNLSQGSPKDYAMMLLEQAGITNLESLNSVFLGDPGFEVGVRERAFGRGLEFEDVGVSASGRQRGTWFLFERMPGDGADYLRARVFNTFEGAAAEFAVKLRLHPDGDVKITESLSSPGAWQLSFSGEGRQMVMAPLDTSRETGTTGR